MSPRKRARSTKSDAAPESLREYRRKRDFTRTPEPSGNEEKPAARRKSARAGVEGALQFVIQKHAASHLHFDFRLELDGAMKSWAVPKGPSLDPSVKRLAMEVEDHPMDYNSFEGTIPKGQYGGGTVMLWDRGAYTADGADGDPVAALRAGYRRGDLKIWLDGERLRGAWVLRRMKPHPGGGSGERAQWLLIKRHDEFTEPGSDVVATNLTSVESGRTMEEIAAGKGRVWKSNKPVQRARSAARGTASGGSLPRTADPGPRTASGVTMPESLTPMLATIAEGVPRGEGWTFEPKYDGIRVLAYVTPGAPAAVTLVTRNLKDKSKQFPEVVEALGRLAAQVRRPVVIDGEIVAIDDDGKPARFQALQSRMHVIGRDEIAGHATDTPSALYAFDLLLDGEDVLVQEPWSARRGRLEKLLRNRTTPRLRLAESFPNDGERMVEHAREQGWEGVIAKRMNARYEPGARSRAWLKLKVEWRQELVVGGWTEPRNSRQHLGALLLGYHDGDRFVYVGHTGGGMDGETLRKMAERLAPLEQPTSPFSNPVKTNERPHWVDPRVVVEVKFSQWTADGKLRHPIFLGIRDDKAPRDVRLEPTSLQSKGAPGLRPAPQTPRGASRAGSTRPEGRRPQGAARRRRPQLVDDNVVAELARITREGGDGVVALPEQLEVTNLGKVFFPEDGITKGDLMRYYTRMSPYVLPVVADRPLVLKRYPNGIHGKAFYQQRAPDDVPAGVRVETVRNDDGDEQPRIIGGDLVTLLWTVQLGAISVDPWLSRIQTCDDADVAIIDLDPGPDATLRRVVDVARWTKEELDDLGLRAALKTSGATGLHVCLPLPRATSYETAQVLAHLVASRVAERHPEAATIERSVKARPADAVYVDYLQNIRGKTVAGAYAVRARPAATVSTPLAWSELTDDLDPRAFTMERVPARVAATGDLWADAMRRPNTLATLQRVAEGKRRVAGRG